MATINNTQKTLIEALATTHQEPAKAFKIALKQARTQEQAEQIKRIAKAFKIDLFYNFNLFLLIKCEEWDTIKIINFTEKTHTNADTRTEQSKRQLKETGEHITININQANFYHICEWLDRQNFKYINK